FVMPCPPPASPLVPYTTLFRSHACSDHRSLGGKPSRSTAPIAGRSETSAVRMIMVAPAQRAGSGPAAVEGRSAGPTCVGRARSRSEEHTSELQSRFDLVCRLLL